MLGRQILSAVIGLVVVAGFAFAESKSKEAVALIVRAKQLSDIRANGSPAFVLKGDFTITRDPDHPITGSYTEIWVSSSLLRIEISAADFHSTKVINDRKGWELSNASQTPKDISSAASRVAYQTDHLSLDSRGPAKIIDRANGSWVLRCIVGHDDGFGGQQELCFDKLGGQFVAESLPFISQQGELVSRCAFADFQRFGDKLFPKTIRCLEGEKQVLDARVVQLTFQEPPDRSIFAAPPGAKEFPNCPVQARPPQSIESPSPVLPLGGPVVLSLMVGTDGKPDGVKVETSAGAETDKAALDAVRRWRFKPATCEGQPMESHINVVVTSQRVN